MNSSPPSPAGRDQSPADWRVDIEEKGRCGSVIYREPAGVITLDWEFGGGDAVAIITGGDEATWRAQHTWALARRTEILQRVAAEVIRQKAPASRAEIDAQTGSILIRQVGPPPPPRPSTADPLSARARYWKFRLILAGIVLLGALAFIAMKSLFSVRSAPGTPLALSVRTPEHIATFIQTLESYVPSLHRDPSKDRYRLALFLYPVDGSSTGRMIPIARHRPVGDFNLAKLLGSDGHTVWFNFSGLGGVNLQTGKLISPAELRRANPAFDETWEDSRRISFAQRLRVTSPDRRQVLEVEPATLKAVPAEVERTAAALPFDPAALDFLSAGVRPTPNQWLGLHSPQEAERDFKPKSRLARRNPAQNAKVLRRFYRGELGDEQPGGRQEILALTPVADAEYLNAAFVCGGAGADPLRLTEPDGFLMIHTSTPGLAGTLLVARVDVAGKVLWQVDTGIDRFKLSQILPDTRFTAFIGTRPPVPNKVSEPILAVVDTQSGKLSVSTLWK
ncbi:MAG: hypothetical protein PCFJNLEI_02141 [Verrucomicrobiae bacterium]|nr:hypothetical protein [Verrucomicrobiae bacterium]